MLRRAKANGLPLGVVVGDEGYGTSTEFRRGVRKLGLHYALTINRETKVILLDDEGRPTDEALSAYEYGLRLAYEKKAYQRATWRNGTKGPLSARFAVRRVIPYHNDGTPPERRERAWLVCEWRDGEDQPAHFHLAVVPHTVGKKQLIRLIKERWKTERVYQDLKGELGLDHFEGRRYPGWHHHVTVALASFAFIVAERARRFFPSDARDFLDEGFEDQAAPDQSHSVAA
jgi:SRSO17 transposase